MKKMIIATIIMATLLTGCGKTEVSGEFETEKVTVEAVETEKIETEAKTNISDEYLDELEYNSQNNGF